MPEAFCGFETVRKKILLNLWVLWEKKLPKNRVSRPVGVTSHTTPLPAGEGSGEGPLSYELETVRKKVLLNLWVLWEKNLSKNRVSGPVGVTSHITPLPAGEGLGEGPLSYEFETVRKNAPWTLCALWEIKLPSESHVSHLLERVRSFSHRFTQKNRTHKGPQRH